MRDPHGGLFIGSVTAVVCLPSGLSALYLQAQDLGLHRAESVNQNIEMRRRLWGICVISDRWYVSAFRTASLPQNTGAKKHSNADTHLALRISLTFGHPYMIDIRDCDARLPSSGDPNDLYMDELVRLSVILGRVQKTIYT